MSVKLMTHPLEALPVAAVAQWVGQQAILLAQPAPLRERVRLHVIQTRGEEAVPFFFRLGTTLGAVTRHRGLTFAELKACKLSARELFADDGVAASLTELVACGTIVSIDDVLALGVEAADLLGPFSSEKRHARLSVSSLHDAFQTEVTRIVKDVFKLAPAALVAMHGPYLYPSDFAALSLRFDGKQMRSLAVIKEVRKLIEGKRLFHPFPLTKWISEAGLDDSYFALVLGKNDESLVNELKLQIWGKSKQ
jgi:hypothetical protein